MLSVGIICVLSFLLVGGRALPGELACGRSPLPPPPLTADADLFAVPSEVDIDSSYELFAVVGGKECAEALVYGPSAITADGSADGFAYYLSTSTEFGSTPHTDWLQIVQDTSSQELFRIYWHFHSYAPLSERFVPVYTNTEWVSYRIVDTAGLNGTAGREYLMQGNWSFSSGSAITADIFSAPKSTCCFSASGGVWGAASGTVDGNRPISYLWGQVDYRAVDAHCGDVLVHGQGRGQGRSLIYVQKPAPSAAPTTPSSQPTFIDVPSEEYKLFAVIGRSYCASTLCYAARAVSPSGAADDTYSNCPDFLSTIPPYGDYPHTEWLQVMQNATTKQELFRVYYLFEEARSFEKRFTDYKHPHNVTFRVVDTAGLAGEAGKTYSYTTTWMYSSASHISNTTTFNGETVFRWGFSHDSGAWGAASKPVDGEMAMPPNFWGVGNFRSNEASCTKLYANGVYKGTGVKGLLYLRNAHPPPSPMPTMRPSVSLAPTSIGEPYELFAKIGDECAMTLSYGPHLIDPGAATDGKMFYFNTATEYGEIPHREWIQFVQKPGAIEVFRIYYTFDVEMTLSQRFAGYGTHHKVSFRVVDTAGQAGTKGKEYFYNTTWAFSTFSQITEKQFAVTKTTSKFSMTDGAWGAGSKAVDGAEGPPANFWGQGNFNMNDVNCKYVYVNGNKFTNTGMKSFLYLKRVLSVPTNAPTVSPSLSFAPTFNGVQDVHELFAVVGAECAETMFYGPSAITAAGSADGHKSYLSTTTPYGTIPHGDWLQIVEDASGKELFRIYWSFDAYQTLAERFSMSSHVYYRIVDTSGVNQYPGREYYKNGTWTFSSSSAMTADKFHLSDSTCCFSKDSGAWGAGTKTIDGKLSSTSSKFWGQGNFGMKDSDLCGHYYCEGYKSSITGVKSLFYLRKSEHIPTNAPSARPTPSFAPTFSGIPLDRYEIFATIGDGMCGQQLPYGPLPLTAEGYHTASTHYYSILSTATYYGETAHKDWLQVVLNSTTGEEAFRIYWAFDDAVPLSERFADRQTKFPVSYRIVDTAGVAGVAGEEYNYRSTWTYSFDSGITTKTFQVTGVTYTFSKRGSAWGGGPAPINGGDMSIPQGFWGLGGFIGDGDCKYYYANGAKYGPGARSVMYLLKG